MKKIRCQILDLLIDDAFTIWQILSDISHKIRLSDQEIVELVYKELLSLLSEGCITVYGGTDFVFDFEEIPNFVLTKEFMLNHKDDWKTKQYNSFDYRFGITEKGIAAHNHCSPEDFV